MRVPTVSELRENPRLFVELMDRYGIKPIQLGITSAYKCQLKRGLRKPSASLCERLLEMIKGEVRGARSQLEAAARPLGIHDISIVKSPQASSNIAVDSYTMLGDIVNIIDNVNILEGFRSYLHSRFVKDDARLRYSYVARHGKAALSNPLYITRLTYSQAKHLMRGLASLRDYLRVLGYSEHAESLDSYLRNIRKIAPRKQRVKLLEYEEDTGIVDKALNELNAILKSDSTVWKITALTMFYTGLRSTEIVYLINNIKLLRAIEHDGVMIVELGYERKSKKAWITMLPKQLYDLILESGIQITTNTISNMRDRKGIHASIFRKSHLAILSSYLAHHEIDLLQGRVSSIIVKHYTKHLREIAEKYLEAFKPYLHLLSF